MTSVGTNRETGAILTGRDQVAPSIRVILQTPIGSRVMRRDFGANIPVVEVEIRAVLEHFVEANHDCTAVSALCAPALGVKLQNR